MSLVDDVEGLELPDARSGIAWPNPLCFARLRLLKTSWYLLAQTELDEVLAIEHAGDRRQLITLRIRDAEALQRPLHIHDTTDGMRIITVQESITLDREWRPRRLSSVFWDVPNCP